MSNIKILDPFTANQIAAGEVVERPASVVKELCENALDAGASVISITIQNGGIVSISVVDNGTGMDREDAKVAFLRHATSKLNSIMDFDTIKTMGFRGEALASIASVSKITLKTKQQGSADGTIVKISDGNIIEHGPVGCPEGTNILVEYLFYNTPARYKFLKKDSTEASYITDIIERFVLARPDVSFRLTQNNQEVIHSPGNNDLKSAIFSIYGKTITQGLIPVSYQSEHVKVDGFAGKPEIGRNTRVNQSIFVNNRYIKSKIIAASIEESYKTLMMKGKFAFCVLNITVNPSQVDINVHPQKTEVKFWNDSEIFRSVLHAIKDSLSEGITIPDVCHGDGPIGTVNFTGNTDINKSESVNTQATNQFPLFEQDKENPELLLQEDPFSIKGKSQENSQNISDLQYDSIPVCADAKEYVQEEQPDLKVNELFNARYIGSLFNTYLILELDQNLIMIDQHAAHERILFEKLVSKYRNKMPIAQHLLTPELIELTAHEIILVNEHIEILSKIGFECEIFGAKTVVLRTVPLDSKVLDIKSAFRAVLDSLSNSLLDLDDQISNAFYSIACKAAVKAHDSLKDLEISHLLEQLQQIPNPTHCPHGRPIVLKMSKYEIEKSFKRIVT